MSDYPDLDYRLRRQVTPPNSPAHSAQHSTAHSSAAKNLSGAEQSPAAAAPAAPQHRLYSKKMAIITSNCGTVAAPAAERGAPAAEARWGLAPDESSVILLHPPLPLAGVSIVMERGRQQNDSLVNG